MPNGSLFPGLNLSIIRQASTGQAGQPILITGRLTAVGLGFLAFIRVTLEGPTYEPSTVHFTTLSAPVTGDYGVSALPPKDGRYEVYAQAFALPPIPILDLLPPGPSLAESPHPPLVIGRPVPGGVSAETPAGPRTLPTPPLSPIEIRPYISVAPSVSISIPSTPGMQPPATIPMVVPRGGAAAAIDVVGTEIPAGEIIDFEVQ